MNDDTFYKFYGALYLTEIPNGYRFVAASLDFPGTLWVEDFRKMGAIDKLNDKMAEELAKMIKRGQVPPTGQTKGAIARNAASFSQHGNFSEVFPIQLAKRTIQAMAGGIHS